MYIRSSMFILNVHISLSSILTLNYFSWSIIVSCSIAEFKINLSSDINKSDRILENTYVLGVLSDLFFLMFIVLVNIQGDSTVLQQCTVEWNSWIFIILLNHNSNEIALKWFHITVGNLKQKYSQTDTDA